jgi:hypothetical protein
MARVANVVKQLEIQTTRRATARQRVSYWDLELDRRRAEYELEMVTNINEASARVTEAQWLALKTDLDADLYWSQVHLLLGNPPNAPIAEISKSFGDGSR